METNSLSKYTISFGLALALCSVVNAVVVVIKEKSPAVAERMKEMLGHHWVTHSAIVVALFLVCGWVFALPNGGQGIRMTAGRLLSIIVSGVVLGGAIIMGFYLVGD